jgi:hypothetical protein
MSKLRIASGIISSKAIDKNNAPEKVIAILIIDPYLKHCIPDINLPKSITYPKNTNIRIIFISKVASIF